MDKTALEKILRKHQLWLSNETDGKLADLRGANLKESNLRGADFRDADFSGADFVGADLEGADFVGADLRGADLRLANLRWANLEGADLRGADLGADLEGANLNDADLRNATGNFVIGYLGKHHAIAVDGYISIGCMTSTYKQWLEYGEEIGKDNGYTDAEVADYMDWIKLAIRALERMNRKDK